MVEATPGDVTMLGLDGVRVLAVDEVDGELEVTIETTETRVGCRGCGVIASAHARREVVVRDVAAFGRRSPVAVAQAGVALPGAAVLQTRPSLRCFLTFSITP